MKRKDFIQKAAFVGAIPFLPIGKINAYEEEGQPKLSHPDLQNSYWYIGTLMSILISEKDTNGVFSLIHGFEIRGMEPPPHTHTREDESFYVIDGEMEFTVAGKKMKAKAGDWVFLPKNVQHSFQVITEKVEVLIHLTPGGFEGYFVEMSRPAKSLNIPPRPDGPPDVQKIIETAGRYGVVFPKR